MFSAILALILFIVSIPIKTVSLAIKVKQYSGKKKSGGSLRKRLGLREKEEVQTKDKKPINKKIQRALKVLVASLKAIALFLKTIAAVIAVIGFIVNIMLLCGLFFMAAAVGGFVLLLSDSNIVEELANKKQAESVVTTTGTSYLVETADGIVEAITTMGNWYITNVAAYNQSGFYSCSLLGGGDVRADCTGFAQAVVRYLNGEQGVEAKSSQFSLGSSGAMMVSGSGWDKAMLANGWVRLDAGNMQVTDLKPGDLMCQNGHFEFFISVNQKFGWGSVQKSCPKSCTWSKRGSCFSDGYHHSYSVVYRYVGKSGE